MPGGRPAGRATRKADTWTVATGQAARWVALELDVRAPRTWFGPSWAVLGGIVASGRVPFEARSLVVIALTWLLAEPLLGSLLALSVEIGKKRAARHAEAPVQWRWTLPYVQPGTPGQRALDRLAARAARLAWTWQILEGAGGAWLLLALMVLLVGVVIGGGVGLLAVAAVVALLFLAGNRPLRADRRKLAGAGHFLLAWLLGRLAFAGLDYRVLLVGVGYAAIWYAWTKRPPLLGLLVAAQALLAVVLVIGQAPVSAAAVLILVTPLFVLWPESPSGERLYPQRTQVFLMASLLLAAWALVV